MSNAKIYKDYVIESSKEAKNPWKAKVAALIRLTGDRPVSSIIASSRYCEEDALDEAKNMIDRGGEGQPGLINDFGEHTEKPGGFERSAT